MDGRPNRRDKVAFSLREMLRDSEKFTSMNI